MTGESAAGEVTLPAWETDYRMEGGEMGPIRRSAIHARRVLDPTRVGDRGEIMGGYDGDDPPTEADLAAAARAESCGHVTDEDGPEDSPVREPAVRFSQFHPKYPGMTMAEAMATKTNAELARIVSLDLPGAQGAAGELVRRRGSVSGITLTSDDLNADIQGNCKFIDTLRDAPEVPSSVLTEAETAVTGPRQRDYDHPVRNFALIAQDWRNWIYARHGIMVPLDGRDVAFMNAGQKRCREAHSRKHDNRVDTCGYMRALQLGEESALRQFDCERFPNIDRVPESERLTEGMLHSTWKYLLE